MTLQEDIEKIMKDAIAATPAAIRATTGGDPIGPADTLDILGGAERGHREAILRLAREIEQL